MIPTVKETGGAMTAPLATQGGFLMGAKMTVADLAEQVAALTAAVAAQAGVSTEPVTYPAGGSGLGMTPSAKTEAVAYNGIERTLDLGDDGSAKLKTHWHDKTKAEMVALKNGPSVAMPGMRHSVCRRDVELIARHADILLAAIDDAGEQLAA